MPTEIYLIKSGMTMTEGVVEEWYVADGGTVTEGDLLYRLETEKINLDVDAEATGTVKHHVGIGEPREPGDVIGLIYADGEVIPEGAEPTAAAAVAAPAEATTVTAPAAGLASPATQVAGRVFSSPAARRLARELGVDVTLASASGPGGRIVEADVQALAQASTEAGATASATSTNAGGATAASSPVARKIARELNVDLATVAGTGPGGRITKEDVEAAHAKPPQPAQPAPIVGDQTIAHSGMRKTIARRMHDSLQEMAQLTMDMDVAMDDAVRLRNQLVEEWADDGIKPTYNDLVIKACAKALEKHPLMNASFTDTALIAHGAINVGMAVALDEGLIVPVVKSANALGMKAMCAESARLARAARESTLSVDDMQDGTFTVSALGMFGVDSFTPIINSPQAGILGVNRIRDDVRWDGNTPVRTQVMRISLTWDHRVLDGAPAAQFLQTVKSLLESPFRLLV